jgi:hypothetical protein
MNKEKSKSRIYICHTFYHVYVSCLKEFNFPASERGKADIILSLMSNDWGNLSEKLHDTGLFGEVFIYDEKREDYFPELAKWKKDKGNIVANMFSRIIFTKKFGKLQAPFIPTDLREYKDIYVYCDADPIGYYLSTHRIKYHALEDGLDTLADCVEAIYDNRGCFPLKQFLSEKLNLIFIRDGYNKYCLDIEVNNVSIIRFPYKKYIEVSRSELASKLTKEDKEILLRLFIKDYDDLMARISSLKPGEKNILILTEPLCELNVRKKIFADLIEEYSKEGNVYLKPHPRDVLDYNAEFPETPSFEGKMPMEVFNFIDGFHFAKVISVYTHVSDIKFADESIMLGHDFMDKYEDPGIHRKDDAI